MDKLELLIQKWQTRESSVKSNLISTKDDQLIKQVIKILNGLKLNLIELNNYGEQNDFSIDLKYNGYRSFAKLNTIALKRVESELIDQAKSVQLNEKKIKKCLAFLKFINKLNLLVLETTKKNQKLNKKDVNQNRKEYKLLFDEKMTIEIFEQYFAMKEDFKVYLDGHLSFYLTNQLKLLVHYVCKFLLLSSYLPFSLFILFNKERTLNTMYDAIINPTISWPNSMEIINKPVICSFARSLATFRNSVRSQTFYIPKQQKWLLKTLDECNFSETTKFFKYSPVPNDESNRSQLKSNNQNLKANGIRVKLIKHKSKPKDGIVLFHVHGGKF